MEVSRTSEESMPDILEGVEAQDVVSPTDLWTGWAVCCECETRQMQSPVWRLGSRVQDFEVTFPGTASRMFHFRLGCRPENALNISSS
jgi:hypothetical protein